MTLVLDAGALLAIESGDRARLARLKRERMSGQVAVTHGGVVGQVWRGAGPRQALLSGALRFVETAALDEELGRRAGELLAYAGAADVVDAALVRLARDGDEIHTSDPGDIERLVRAADVDAKIVTV